MIGKSIGPYQVLSKLGEGGMGEVYRATDTKLKRQVAIKILPPSLAADQDRLARFQREAEVLASLNHPHIAGIYGLEESPSTSSGQAVVTALVMELVEGEDLSQRIARGAVPIDEALPIAKQIAEALEAAHEQGIIHRDLKPANIKVRADGTVKVLDFGLAKAMEPASASSAKAMNSPTLSMHATQAGVILGTAAYMAPEQARGKTVDKRADIWAFGAVLYEMLTSRRAFPGEDITDTIVSVVSKEPDWSALPAATTAGLRRLLVRCLKKDPKARMRDIGEARLQLEELVGGAPEEMPAAVVAQAAPAPRPLWRRALPVAATAVVVSAMAIAATWTLKPTPPTPPSPVTRFALTLGEGQQFSISNNPLLAISPDGTLLAYAANSQLYLRSMADLEARPIPGTQRTPSPYSPVFSPDGRSLAFYSPADRAVKKIAVSGGAAITLCPAEGISFGSLNWDASGIVFRPSGKDILRVSPSGGQPETLVRTKESEFVYGPQVLPGGEWVLFTLATAATVEGWDTAQIVVQSLKTAERKTLVSGGSNGRYLPTGLGSPKRSEREGGHLVYALGGVVFAMPFDPGRLATTGGPVPIVEGVRRATTGQTGVAQFSVSSSGTLVFIPGPVTTSGGQWDLALIDRTGAAQPLKLPPAAYEYPRLSPDGKRIAVGSDDGKEAIVWIDDLSGTTAIRRLTLGGRNRVPVWSADGEHVAFQSDREGDRAIWWQRADGTTPAERLTKPDDKDTAQVPESWSPDGRTLLFSVAKGSSYSLAVLSLPDKNVTLFGGVQSTTPPAAAFSPDGKWVAYSVGGPGSPNNGSLFVQPFPATGATYPISKGVGIHATWSPDGKELFYSPGSGQLVAVSVTTRPAFTFGSPVSMARMFRDRGPVFERDNDITRDGKQFLGVVAAGSATTAAAAPQMQVVLNWFEELKQRVPTK